MKKIGLLLVLLSLIGCEDKETKAKVADKIIKTVESKIIETNKIIETSKIVETNEVIENTDYESNDNGLKILSKITEGFEEYYEEGYLYNYLEDEGGIEVISAITIFDEEKAKELIEGGVDVNAKNSGGGHCVNV